MTSHTDASIYTFVVAKIINWRAITESNMEVAIPLETHEHVINLKLLKCRTEKLSKLLKNENLANIKSKIRKKRGV